MEWAEGWAGPGAVFFAGTSGKDGDRADLLVAPIRDSRGKPVISTQKALTELVRQTREITEYSALQTSWVGWCAAHINPSIQRGARRGEVGADAKPARPVSSSFATIREAIVQADLSEHAAERLGALLRIKVEVVRFKGSDAGGGRILR
ncbi:MAG: hypothetical protein Q4P24_13310 [Rhodobacterales bacterium]|nr:hypothetical protein [Rhodobacterales bacterium]